MRFKRESNRRDDRMEPLREDAQWLRKMAIGMNEIKKHARRTNEAIYDLRNKAGFYRQDVDEDILSKLHKKSSNSYSEIEDATTQLFRIR